MGRPCDLSVHPLGYRPLRFGLVASRAVSIRGSAHSLAAPIAWQRPLTALIGEIGPCLGSRTCPQALHLLLHAHGCACSQCKLQCMLTACMLTAHARGGHVRGLANPAVSHKLSLTKFCDESQDRVRLVAGKPFTRAAYLLQHCRTLHCSLSKTKGCQCVQMEIVTITRLF